MGKTEIIVLTPVKNEEWILDTFLQVTSRYADRIILLDQNSTDNSASIARKYPKVLLMTNPSDEYDEASRQHILIEKARQVAPEAKRILLALDSDEILAADFSQHRAWQQMLDAIPGTVLLFNKVDIYRSPNQYLDYNTPWPLGFVDDGSDHRPRKVHSIRIPNPPSSPKLIMEGVYILHYAMVDMARQRAKMRMYAAVERVNRTSSFYNRRKAYGRHRDWTSGIKVRQVPDEWLNGWTQLGANLIDFQPQASYWQDLKVLELFKKHGSSMFFSEDIWDNDWERLGLPKHDSPSPVISFFYGMVFRLNRAARKTLGTLLRRKLD